MSSLRILVSGVLAVALLSACGGSDAATSSAGSPVAGPVAPSDLHPKGRTVSGLPVDRVIDGDTVKVFMDGEDVTVRLIGMNTPETVKPDSPVECYGPEASDFAKQALTDQRVTLEFDASQGETDQYGRTLAYVWIELPDGGLRLFNEDAIAGGYAFERQYGPTPYAWKTEFSEAARQARSADAGLWGACDY